MTTSLPDTAPPLAAAGQASSRLDRTFIIGMYVCFALFMILTATIGRFPGVDEVFFKTAGKEWALHGHFTAPDIPSVLHLDPPTTRVFAMYPPVYPFLFGIWSKVFGFGWKQGCLFDGVIHVALCWMIYWLGCRLAEGRGKWIAALAAILFLPLGTESRPDELGMCFGLAALGLTASHAAGRKIWMAGIALGLAMATSPAASVAFAIMCAPIILIRCGVKIGLLVRQALLIGAAMLLVQACAWGPVLAIDSRALHQFATHIAALQRLPRALTGLQPFTRCIAFPAAAGLCAEINVLMLLARCRMAKKWLGWFSGVAVASAYVINGHSVFYLWFIVPPLFLLIGYGLFDLPPRLRGVSLSLVLPLLMIGIGVGSIPRVVMTAALAVMPREQSLQASMIRVRSLIPLGSVVAVTDHWYAMAADYHTLDSDFCDADSFKPVQYVVLSGNGGGEPGHRQPLTPALEEVLAHDFEQIDDNISRAAPRLMGMKLTNSSRGFGAIIFRRKVPATTK